MEKTTDRDALYYLGRALGSLGTQQILAAMKKTTDSDALKSLVRALFGLDEQLPVEETAAVTQQIVANIEKTTGSSTLDYLGDALDTFVVQLKAEDVMSVLESLPCVGNTRSRVLASLWWRIDGDAWTFIMSGGHIKVSIWDAVEWAEKQGVDVENVPRWPLKVKE